MPVRKISNTQTETGAWSASSAGISINIERVGLLTRMDMTVELVPSATLGGANQPGGPFRSVRNLTLAGAQKTYFTLPSEAGGNGGVLLKALNDYQGFGAGTTPTVITAPRPVFTPINFVYHPGSFPQLAPGRQAGALRGGPFDLSSFVPAGLEGQLTLTWVTTANTVMDDTVTLSSAVMRITNHRVMGSHEEIMEEMRRQGVLWPMTPAWSAVLESPSAAATDFGSERDIPSGGFLRGIYIAEQDATGTRPIMGGDQVTGIAVKKQHENEWPLRMTQLGPLVCHMPHTAYAVADDGADNGAHARYGAYILDLRAYTSSENPLGGHYGLDMRNVGSNGLRLALTITEYAAGDDIFIIYDKLLPWPTTERLA